MKPHISSLSPVAGALGLPLIATSHRPSMRFTAERNRDLRAIALRLVKSTDRAMTRDELVERTISHTAPGYYADYDYAVHIIPRLLRLPREVAARRAHGKWLEIADRAREAMAEGNAANLSAAIAYVLGRGNASRFFIAPATAHRIIFT